MERKTRNVILIVVGVVVLLVVLCVAALAGFAYYMYRQMDVTTVASGNVEQQFSDIEARFKGQTPYLELFANEDREPVVHRELEKTDRAKLQWLHVAAYDPRDNKLVQLRLPFWLLRLGGGNKPINLRNHMRSGFDLSTDISVTPEDLERRGPGLLLDTTGRRGEHVVMWLE